MRPGCGRCLFRTPLGVLKGACRRLVGRPVSRLGLRRPGQQAQLAERSQPASKDACRRLVRRDQIQPAYGRRPLALKSAKTREKGACRRLVGVCGKRLPKAPAGGWFWCLFGTKKPPFPQPGRRRRPDHRAPRAFLRSKKRRQKDAKAPALAWSPKMT